MDLLAYLIYLAIGGLIIGALARLLVPGPDPTSFFGTIALGVGSALVAGAIATLVLGESTSGGFLLSLAVAIMIVLFLRRTDRLARTPTTS